jgi:hypothetical protein
MMIKKYLLLALVSVMFLLFVPSFLDSFFVLAFILFLVSQLPVNPLSYRTFKEELYWHKKFVQYNQDNKSPE